MKTKRVILSVLLAICFVLTFASSVTFAAGTENREASADGIEYATLKEALEKGGNVKLLQNVEVDSVITIDKSVTLDLGNYTITNKVEGERPFHVTADSFIINADKGGMVIPEENDASYGFIKIISTAEFSLNGGTYMGNTDNG